MHRGFHDQKGYIMQGMVMFFNDDDDDALAPPVDQCCQWPDPSLVSALGAEAHRSSAHAEHVDLRLGPPSLKWRGNGRVIYCYFPHSCGINSFC